VGVPAPGFFAQCNINTNPVMLLVRQVGQLERRYYLEILAEERQ
jgi:hypothetical protein